MLAIVEERRRLPDRARYEVLDLAAWKVTEAAVRKRPTWIVAVRLDSAGRVTCDASTPDTGSVRVRYLDASHRGGAPPPGRPRFGIVNIKATRGESRHPPCPLDARECDVASPSRTPTGEEP